MNIIDPSHLLSSHQTDLLHQYAGSSYTFGKFSSIDDILVKLNVDVIIDPRVIKRIVPPFLTEAKEYWNKEIERLQAINDAESKKALNEVGRQLDLISKECGEYEKMLLRGLYEPDFNVIRLFPSEMQMEDNGQAMDELLVTTLFHETMHAYFNRPLHTFPYVYFVEEPMAEFGMLVFINKVAADFYNWAYNDVNCKRTCYRLGAELMNWFLRKGEDSYEYKCLLEYKYELIGPDIYRYPLSIIDIVQRGGNCTVESACGFFVKRNGSKDYVVIGLKGDIKIPLHELMSGISYDDTCVVLANTFRMSGCQNEKQEMLKFCQDIISAGGQLFVSGRNAFCSYLGEQMPGLNICDDVEKKWSEWMIDDKNNTFTLNGNWCLQRKYAVVLRKILDFITLALGGHQWTFIAGKSFKMGSDVENWMKNFINNKK